MTIFHRGISRDYVNLAVDWISHNIYWTDASYQWIMIKSLASNDMSMYRVLIHENLAGPRALTLDPMEGLLFWSDTGLSTRIEVSGLSGSNRKTLISSKLDNPGGLAADYAAKRLYLHDSRDQTLETFTYEGKDRKILVRRRDLSISCIAVYKDFLYMIDKDRASIHFLNKTNGNALHIRQSGRTSFFLSLGLFVLEPKVHPGMGNCMEKGCEHMCVVEKDVAICLCKDGYSLNEDNTTCSLRSEFLHRALMFTNATNICTADIRVLTDFSYSPMCITDFNDTKHMILDTDERNMILATTNDVYWASVDSPEMHHLTHTNGTISGLAWDGYNRSLYWTEDDTGTIWQSTLESTTPYAVVSDLNQPRDIICIPSEGRLYWISNGPIIQSCKIDGSDQRILLNGTELMDPKSLTYDPYEKRIYYRIKSPNNESAVNSFALDGSDVERFILTFNEVIDRLLIYKGHLLLTFNDVNGTLIRSYSLGSKIETTSGVFDSTGQISTIMVFDENIRQNETDPCLISNGQCEDICIPQENTRVCDCRFGFRLTENGINCTSDPIEDEFMLAVDSSDNTVYQISLMNQNLQGIIKSKDSISGVIYRPSDKVFLFGAKSKLMVTYLNGTTKEEFPVSHSGGIYYTPNRFALDYSTGNIYYTVANDWKYVSGEDSFISVISPSGIQRTLVRGLVDPSGIAVYPSKGWLFYSEGEYRPRLGKARMDGEEPSVLLHLWGEEPSDLTIDYNSDTLYYMDGTSRGIKYCNLDGRNHGALFRYYATGLSAVFVYNDHLFVTTKKNTDIRRIEISKPRVTSTFANPKELGIINFINIYSSKDQNQNEVCSDNNGGCSAFCFPIPDGSKCGCADGMELKEGSQDCTKGKTFCEQNILHHYDIISININYV
ncbi:hypothetical protein ACJMK2_003272 [Sinanodonta woodiana]|uniref:EGF-like domain-containing protein n=1 Tax=Sinanodonta woodiana TaxID=1069815 RepID=A0ABD3Y0X8_SINWO